MVGEAISMDIDFCYIDVMLCGFVGDNVINLVPMFGAQMLPGDFQGVWKLEH